MKDKFLAMILLDLPKEIFVSQRVKYWTHFFWGGKFQVCVLVHVIDLDKNKKKYIFFFWGGDNFGKWLA